MTDIRKQKFRTIEADTEEIEQETRKRRRKIIICIAAAAVILAIGVGAAGIYYNLKEYEAFEIRSQMERSDSEATKDTTVRGRIMERVLAAAEEQGALMRNMIMLVFPIESQRAAILLETP